MAYFRKFVILVGMLFLISACTATNDNKQEYIEIEKIKLRKFAQANCLLWYFKDKGYDETDIRSISGGYVEKASSSAETFQNIALLVKDYKPSISTKNNIDPKLYKCFILDEYKELNSLINGT